MAAESSVIPGARQPVSASDPGGPLRLHIGGIQARDGWKILNVLPGPHVDFTGSCTDLSRFGDACCDGVYASHVLEHLDYQNELPRVLGEIHRILKPGCDFYISVPDLDTLCSLFTHSDVTPQERFGLMRMMFGGQIDAHDFHKVGFNWEILSGFLAAAGFEKASIVEQHNIFDDTSALQFRGNRISLNVIAHR